MWSVCGIGGGRRVWGVRPGGPGPLLGMLQLCTLCNFSYGGGLDGLDGFDGLDGLKE